MATRSSFFLWTLAMLGTLPVLASGSYPPNPPRLGGTALAKIDASAYNLGKIIFTDRVALPTEPPPGNDASANLTRLTVVQAQLPERVRAEVDLTALATRLDTTQVDALLYYLSIRFRIAASPPSAS